MVRTITGAAIGIVVGMLILAGWGAWYGYENGVPTAWIPPGREAAWVSALVWSVFLFWMGMLPGAVIGGAAGFGSWLVQPRRRAKRFPSAA